MIDNLHSRRVYVFDWCYMCKKAGEMADQLFLHREYVNELWSLVQFILSAVAYASKYR